MTIILFILKIIGWIILLLLLYLLFWPFKLEAKAEGDSSGVLVCLRILPLLTTKIGISVLERSFDFRQKLAEGAKTNDTLGQVKTFLDAFEKKERDEAERQTPADSTQSIKQEQKENKWQKIAIEYWQELAVGISIDKLNIKIRAGIQDNPAVSALLVGGLSALISCALAPASQLFRRFPAPPAFDIKPDYEQTAIRFEVGCIIHLCLGDIILRYIKAIIIYNRKEKVNYVR